MTAHVGNGANRFPSDGKWIVFNMMPDSLLAKNMFCYKPEHLIEDERFIDSSARYKLMPELIALFDEALSRKSETNGAKF